MPTNFYSNVSLFNVYKLYHFHHKRLFAWLRIVVIWSKRYRPALSHLDRLNTAVIHSGLQQGRSMLGLVVFHQLRSPVLRPSTRSWCEYNCSLMKCMQIPDILRTVSSSRPDTVFLLESWGLLTDLPRSRLHTALGYVALDYRRCWFLRICYDETVCIQFLKFLSVFSLLRIIHFLL